MRERESLAHFLFSSWMLKFFSGRCKFLSPSCLWMRWWRVKAGVFVWERVWRTSALERERGGERENKRKKEREREREKREKEGEGEGVLSLFLFTLPSFQAMVLFTSFLFLDAQWWRGNTLLFLFSLTVFLILSLFLHLTHSLPCTLPFPRPLPPFSLTLPLSLYSLPHLSLSPPHLCVISISVCLIMIACDVWHTFSGCKSFFHWRPPRVLREWAKAEKWRNWREKERERESNWEKREIEREKGMGERILSFFLFLTFSSFPQTILHKTAREGSVECVNTLIKHGADVSAKDVRVGVCENASHRTGDVWGFVVFWRMFAWVWGVVTNTDLGKIYLSQFSTSLSFFLTHFSHPLFFHVCTHAHIHFFPEAIWVCVLYVLLGSTS